MGSGVWDLQLYEVMLSILYVTENTWMEGWKCGGTFKEQSTIHVSTLTTRTSHTLNQCGFFENVDSFSKECVFLVYTEHTVR